MKKRVNLRSPSRYKLLAFAFAGLLAVAGLTYIQLTSAATFAVASEAETGSRTANATLASDPGASGGAAVKFGPATTGGESGGGNAGAGGVCNKPFAQTGVARGDINIGTDGIFQVRNEAWSDSHGPQTIYACSEQSWYVLSNQPDAGGAVQTYPDSLYWVKGAASRTINNYTSVTSTFAEEYQKVGNWNAAYDIWMNDWSKEIMIWNEWNGGPDYWAQRARGPEGTAVNLGGVPYHFAKNGTILQFFRDTQVKSGSVDILAALKWLQTNGHLTASDKLTQIEYGVEICSTVGTQRFDTTGFTVNLN
jgi:hypothetical protein